MNMSDNSYMFVDEEKEDISKAGGIQPKGKYLDETVTGKIEDESTINLVADEDVTSSATVSQDVTDSPVLNEDASGSVALSSDKVSTRGKGLGIASLVFGVISLSLFCSFVNIFASVIGIILGVAQLRRGEGKGLAIAGILCSIGSVVLLMICMNIIMSNEAFVNMILNNMNNIGLYNMI